MAQAKEIPPMADSAGANYQPAWSITTKTLGDGREVDILHSADDAGQHRARDGDRLHRVFDETCAEIGARESRRRVAVDLSHMQYSFAALAGLSNQIAHFLLEKGVRAGDRAAVLFDRSIYSHATVLALSRLDAAYVPLDAAFPGDRIAYIVQDSGAKHVITLNEFSHLFEALDIEAIALDRHLDQIKRQPSKTFVGDSAIADENPLCYIIYTSGSTGRPKGVPIRQASICNFLRVARDCYGYQADDRVYQGMTLAFDFSVEETWVPLCAGATLVPAPPGCNLLGPDLADFLQQSRITALCCVPTLLATLESELPNLRFLLVSGEACPTALARRWWLPDRRFLNVYGPTETTVTATWSIVGPDSRVTIGGPLPTYSILIVEPESETPLRQGETGEICIAGVGLADGYVNRPEQSAKAFIDDFVGFENNPGGKIYRTGDLGRINERNEIEYGGRIDTQIKIRGYRIELNEIESVIEACDDVAQVIVHPHETAPGRMELVSYIKWRTGKAPDGLAALHALLQTRLPAYMVPAFYEEMTTFPTLPSNKVDRKRLPPPAGPRLTDSGRTVIEPKEGVEADLAAILGRVLSLETISADADFFDELGANSLLMAQFVSAVRRDLRIKGVSLKQIYQHSTIQDLAALIDAAQRKAKAASRAGAGAGAGARTTTGKPDAAADVQPERIRARQPAQAHHASTLSYIGCGVAQVLCFAVQAFVASLALLSAFHWIEAANGVFNTYLRAAAGGAALFFGTGFYLIGLKWLVVGRFNEQTIRLWRFAYLRFWIAKTAIQANPFNLFMGTPAYTMYLRLLGARISPRAVLFARPPICTDLVTIGADTIIRQDSFLQAYTSRSGYILPGRVTLGARAFVGEATVLEIDSTIEDDAQLGTSSALLEGQVIPAGKVYQGSPASECTSNFNVVPPRNTGWRRQLYVGSQLTWLLMLALPLPLLLAVMFAPESASASATAIAGTSAVVYFGSIVSGLLVVTAVPRVLYLFVEPGTVHPLYGVQFVLARAIIRLSNSRLLNTVFGDSSMIVYYLSAVGYDLRKSTQTGSNFGVDQRHHVPYLNTFNRNTLVSDGLMLLNMETSSSSFRLSPISVPADSYLGNVIHYPPRAQVGENCLIATKAMVPIDGPLREGVGILGSPPFEIPRSVLRDHKFDHYKKPEVLKQRLGMKLKSNLLTLAMYLFRNWSSLLLTMLLGSALYLSIVEAFGPSLIAQAAALGAVTLFTVVFVVTYSILFERLAIGPKALRPLYCSLYDRDFWNHERFWKMNYNFFMPVFNGTPMKNFFARLQGTRIGRKVFDDGAGISEPDLTRVGDYCCLNFGTSIQGHSLEDGTFKSDRIQIGNGCNLGVRGFIHYGASVGDGATITADSFVIKGSAVESNSLWCGNPARNADEGDFSTRMVEAHLGVGQVEAMPAPRTLQPVAERV